MPKSSSITTLTVPDLDAIPSIESAKITDVQLKNDLATKVSDFMQSNEAESIFLVSIEDKFTPINYIHQALKPSFDNLPKSFKPNREAGSSIVLSNGKLLAFLPCKQWSTGITQPTDPEMELKILAFPICAEYEPGQQQAFEALVKHTRPRNGVVPAGAMKRYTGKPIKCDEINKFIVKLCWGPFAANSNAKKQASDSVDESSDSSAPQESASELEASTISFPISAGMTCSSSLAAMSSSAPLVPLGTLHMSHANHLPFVVEEGTTYASETRSSSTSSAVTQLIDDGGMTDLDFVEGEKFIADPDSPVYDAPIEPFSAPQSVPRSPALKKRSRDCSPEILPPDEGALAPPSPKRTKRSPLGALSNRPEYLSSSSSSEDNDFVGSCLN